MARSSPQATTTAWYGSGTPTPAARSVGRSALGEIVLSLAYSPDGKVLAVGLASDRTGKPGTQLWDVATRQPRSGILPHPTSVFRRRIQARWPGPARQ